MSRVAENQTLIGPLTAGGTAYKWFVTRVRPPRRDGGVTATLEAHLPGVGEEIIKSTATVTFPNGEVTGDWSIANDPASATGGER